MDYCDICDVDLGGTCDHCGNRACEHCIRSCHRCGDTCCVDCYDDESDMCLTCKEEGACDGDNEGEEDED